MKKALKISAIAVGVLILAGVAAKMILLDYTSVPEGTSITATIEEMRLLAAKSGPLPVRINMLNVGMGEFLPGMVVAGERNKKYGAAFICYQVVYEADLAGGGRTVIVDAALDKTQLVKMSKGAVIYDGRYDELQRGMKDAAAVIITHEHFDHAGGIAKSPYFNEICGKVLLTDEQKASPAIIDAGFTQEMLARCGNLRFTGLHLLYPGMVLMKTPGHLPGHQIVFVKLKNGAEFLLAGDIAWHRDNIVRLRTRPILVSLVMGEDRAGVGDQIRWLHDEVGKKHKDVRILVSHDLDQHVDAVKSGALGGSFEL